MSLFNDFNKLFNEAYNEVTDARTNKYYALLENKSEPLFYISYDNKFYDLEHNILSEKDKNKYIYMIENSIAVKVFTF